MIMGLASRAVPLCCLWFTLISDILTISSDTTLLGENSLLYNLIFLLLSHHGEVEVSGQEQGCWG